MDGGRLVLACRPPTDVSSDLTVEVGTSSFALHKVRAGSSSSSSCWLHEEIEIKNGVLMATA
jgi:hypothetical protein